MPRLSLKPLAITAGFVLSACASTDRINPNEARTSPVTFITNTEYLGTPSNEWWSLFGDPRFASIVERAGPDNVAIASAQLDAAEAVLRQRRSVGGLNIDGRVSGSTQNLDGNELNSTRVGVQASVDRSLFGANLRRVQASRLRVDVAEQNLRSARIQSRAAAARLLVEQDRAARQAQASLNTIEALSTVLSLAESRADAGLDSGIDVKRALTALDAARVDTPRFKAERDTARLSLEALLAVPPGTLGAELGGFLDLSTRDVVLDGPAEILARRPDVVSAELLLQAAGLDAQAARADALPSINLSAFFGTQTFDPEFVFNPAGTVAELTAGLTAPIFNAGRLRGQINEANARQAEAFAVWQQTGTQAIADVEIALVRRGSTVQRLRAAATAQASAAESARLLRSRWRAGLTPLTDVLLAERALYDADRTLATARADEALAVINLAEALGLGDANGM